MSRSIAGKIKINSFADLVGGDEGAIAEIPIADLHDFKDHPFRVLDDEKMEEMADSIRAYGVLTPIIARPVIEGGYEIISGHRRKRACEIAGISTIPAVIKNYSDDESTVIMVDSNIQREDILPSEKAKAYRMKYDALKHQGSAGGDSLENIGGASGESRKTVQRYIYLSNLSERLLKLVDDKKLPMMAGVHISFLNGKEQSWVEKVLSDKMTNITPSQAEKLKEYSQNRELTRTMTELILSDNKVKTRRFVMKGDRISEFFTEEVTDEEIEETIINLLTEWNNKGKERD